MLYRYLNASINISRKAITRMGQYRNTLYVKYLRILFFNNYIHIACHKIWIDEFSVNLQIARNYGRAHRGDRAVLLLPPAPGPNISVTIAVGKTEKSYNAL